MLEVKGFRGFRFVAERVGALERVVAPPYDVISPEERQEMAALSPHNMVHLTLPMETGESTRYEAAAHKLDEWISRGVLRQDPSDSLYLLEQVYEDPDGVRHARRGFLGVAKLPEPGEDTVLGHERTFDDTMDDRFRLILATRANLSPVLVLYPDPENASERLFDQTLERLPDDVVHTGDGVIQRVWRVPYEESATAFLEDKRLYIADGHHRFGTARAYRDRMRELEKPDGPRSYDYILMGFVSLSDPGLKVFPTHRLMAMPEGFRLASFLRDLERWFQVTPVQEGLASKVRDKAGCAFGVAIHGKGQYLLELRDVDRKEMLGTDRGPAWRDLDVAVLHRGVIEKLLGLRNNVHFTYERDADAALAAVESGRYGMAFLLKTTPSEQIRACAEAGEPMPHKSTYFYPKMPAGLSIHRLV